MLDNSFEFFLYIRLYFQLRYFFDEIQPKLKRRVTQFKILTLNYPKHQLHKFIAYISLQQTIIRQQQLLQHQTIILNILNIPPLFQRSHNPSRQSLQIQRNTIQRLILLVAVGRSLHNLFEIPHTLVFLLRIVPQSLFEHFATSGERVLVSVCEGEEHVDHGGVTEEGKTYENPVLETLEAEVG